MEQPQPYLKLLGIDHYALILGSNRLFASEERSSRGLFTKTKKQYSIKDEDKDIIYLHRPPISLDNKVFFMFSGNKTRVSTRRTKNYQLSEGFTPDFSIDYDGGWYLSKEQNNSDLFVGNRLSDRFLNTFYNAFSPELTDLLKNQNTHNRLSEKLGPEIDRIVLVTGRISIERDNVLLLLPKNLPYPAYYLCSFL